MFPGARCSASCAPPPATRPRPLWPRVNVHHERFGAAQAVETIAGHGDLAAAHEFAGRHGIAVSDAQLREVMHAHVTRLRATTLGLGGARVEHVATGAAVRGMAAALRGARCVAIDLCTPHVGLWGCGRPEPPSLLQLAAGTGGGVAEGVRVFIVDLRRAGVRRHCAWPSACDQCLASCRACARCGGGHRRG